MNSNTAGRSGLSWRPWLWIGLTGVVMAYVDGFWLISVEGVVGAIGLVQHPFSTWLLESALLVPVFTGGVVAALWLARRRFGPLLGPRRVLAAALLVAAAGTMIGTAAVAASSVHSYVLQYREVAASHRAHAVTKTADGHQTHAVTTASGTVAVDDCDALCQVRRNTAAAHVDAVEAAAVALGLSNLVLVAWVLALRGGYLEPPGS